MLNQVQVTKQRTTFLTPVVPVAADLPIHEQPYTPALLLPLPSLSSALVCDLEFVHACQYGYDDYFEEMFVRVADTSSFTDDYAFQHQMYTFADVRALVVENISLPDCERHQTTPSFCAGFVFGWLSALSKYQPSLARQGITFFVQLVKQEFTRLA